jgi:hypothetical protein
MPLASVRIDHFQPSLARPVAFLPVSLPSSRDFVQTPIDGHPREVQPDDLVVGRDRLVRDGAEDPGLLPLVAPGRAVVSDTLFCQRHSSSSELDPVTRCTKITKTPNLRLHADVLGRPLVPMDLMFGTFAVAY